MSQQENTRPVAFTRPAGITEFGHLCLDAPDVHEAYRFWNTRFNARVSDWIGRRLPPPDRPGAPQAGRVPRRRPGLCHMGFQVATIDDVFRNWHFLIDHDVEIEMGPGRHPQSTAIFLYFLGPEGFTYEYSFGVRRIEDEPPAPRTSTRPSPARSTCGWVGCAVPLLDNQLQPASSQPVPAEAVQHGTPQHGTRRPKTQAAGQNPSAPEGPQ